MKQHQVPEFVIVRQSDSNAKFFVASGNVPNPSNPTSSTSLYSSGSTGGWF